MTHTRRTLRAFCAAVLLSLAAGPLAALAAPLDTWTWRNPLPQGNELSGVAFGNGTFVAVGGPFGGALITSADGGATWSVRSVDTGDSLVRAAYGNGSYVAVGALGRILSSSDAVTWTMRASGTDKSLVDVAYGNGTFVAVGAEGTILTSPDGIAWTRQAAATTASLTAITFGGGKFVATALSNGTLPAQVLISEDGAMWAVVSSGTLDTPHAVAWGNGRFVVVGSRGLILTSDNGFDWTQRTSGTAVFLNAVAFGNGVFYAVGNSNTVLTSTDGGLTWFVGSGPISTTDWLGAAYGSNGLVVVGQQGRIYTFDGTNTVVRSSSITSGTFYNVAYGDGAFVAVGSSIAYTSTDGATWTLRATPICDPGDVAYGNGRFVWVCGGGAILVSTDAGLTWFDRSPAPADIRNMTAVAYGGNLYIAAGRDGAIFTSPDAVTWTLRATGTTRTLRGVGYGNGVYVAVGDGGALLSSTNAGVDWADRAPAGTGNLASVAYGGGTFVAVGESATVLSSADGITWTRRSSGLASSDDLNRVIFANRLFVAFASSGRILTSPDGITWTLAARPTAAGLMGAGFGNDTVVMVGSLGWILQSDPMPALRSLSVTKTGAGTGTVSAAGCTLVQNAASATCIAPAGTNITLTASADSGSVFAGWSAASGSANCSGTGSCTFNLAQDSAVTARFDLAAGAGGDGGGCFIATAAFGSPLDRHVQVLREFRDQVLLRTDAGRAFVAWYYRSSPAASAWIGAHPWSRAGIRAALYPVIGLAWLWLHAPWVLLLAAAAGVVRVLVAAGVGRSPRRPGARLGASI